MDRSKKKISALAVAEIIFIVILALIMAAMLAFNFLFKNKTEPVNIMGTSFYHTKAVTMLPKIPENTLIIARSSEIDNIAVGSVVLCNIGDNTVLIRVSQIQEDEGQTYYVVKFDSAGEKEYRIDRDSVIAKAVWQSGSMGSLINFASSTAGVIIAVVIPLAFIIAVQVARIFSIQKLENEANSLEDIDELISARDEDEEPAPVTFTEPKFIEDITGKLPKLSEDASAAESELQSGVKIIIEDKGREEAPEPRSNDAVQHEMPLFTSERIAKDRESRTREPVLVGAGKPMFGNEAAEARHSHVEIERKKTPADEFFESYAPKDSGTEVSETADIPVRSADPLHEPVSSIFEKGKPVVFTPHLSDVVPGDGAKSRTNTPSAPKKPTSFDESVKVFMDKTYVPEEPAASAAEKAAVQNEQETYTYIKFGKNNQASEKPAAPKPKPKKSSSSSFDDLLNMINAEESKLKK